MCSVLAYADSGDPNSMNLALVLGGALGLAVLAALAAALIFISKARGHRQAELIMGAAFWWAVFAAGSLFYAIVSQINWQKEYAIQLESGDYDASNAPKLPWGIWMGLGIIYAGLAAWAFSRKRAPPVPNHSLSTPPLHDPENPGEQK